MSTPNDDWNAHLRTRFEKEKNGWTFDMDDSDEAPLMGVFAILSKALNYLNSRVIEPYRDADSKAMTHQKWHKRLSAVAIVGGGLAVLLAIAQLAIKSYATTELLAPTEWGALLEWIAVLEWVAAGAGAVAVIIGVFWMRDRKWFVQRCVAERLRMIKFRSLGSHTLWCGDFSAWQNEVDTEIIKATSVCSHPPKKGREIIKEWAENEVIARTRIPALGCVDNAGDIRALADYYRAKRVDFQANFHFRKSKKLKKHIGHMHHASLPLFVVSIVMVILHTILHAAHQEIAAQVALTLAAAIPVVSFGIRAWVSAFEHAKSVSLCTAKYQALDAVSRRIEADSSDVVFTLQNIEAVEHYLENEHREWLRLMLDAEWFL